MINVIIEAYARSKARSYQKEKQFDKQIEFLKIDPAHPSLNYKPLKGGQGLWRFRITKKYWGITLKPEENIITVIDVIIHL